MDKFAVLSIDGAQEHCAVLSVRPSDSDHPADLSLDLESFDLLQRLIYTHIEQMHAIDLASPIVRDVYVQTMARSMLEGAVEAGVCQPAGTLAWTTALGDVCMVMLADERAVDELGAERLIEMAHEDAVRAARDAGQPHDSAALNFYDSRAAAQQGLEVY